jgi:oligosaccharide repeat unit polymerase
VLVIKVLLLCAIVGAFVAAWKAESGWQVIITPFLLLIYYEFVRVLPPFFLADMYEVSDRLEPLLVGVTAFFCLLFGFLMSYQPRKGAKKSLALTLEQQPQLGRVRGEREGVLVIIAFLIVTGMYMFGGFPPVGRAVVGMLSGGGADMADFVSTQRFALTKAAYFGGEYRGLGLIREIQRVGWTLVMSYAVLRFIDRKTWKRLLWAVATVVLAWLFIAGDGTRGPFLNALLMVVAVYSLRKPLKVRSVVLIAGVGVTIAILLSVYSNKMYRLLDEGQGGFVSQAVSRIVERIFIGNGLNDVRTIEMVSTGELELRHGGVHFRNFVSAIPGVEYGVPFSYELFQILNPNSRNTTYLSGTYLSDVFLDFGWWGIFPIFFLTGFIVARFQRRLFQRVRSPWRLAIMTVTGLTAVGILRSGYSGLIAQFVVIGLFAVMHTIVERFARALVPRDSFADPRLGAGNPSRPASIATQGVE